MIFNSLTYLLFLLGVVALYWLTPRRPRLLLIFTASLTFYGFWRVEFLPVMLLSVVVDYLLALRIANTDDVRLKKRLLLASLAVNLGLLFVFKYLLFFANSGIGLLQILGWDADPLLWNIVLPLGISFYTFQTISYTVDVYRGHIRPERDFVLYACYVTFFPQLVAGPILRAAEVIPQLSQRAAFKADFIVDGARRIFYGLFLKVVLADNIAPLVDAGFAVPATDMSALDVWTLAFLFGFQIYFDFSAYSHIALGSARLMGIRFPENFNFPYLATSPKAFWQRWHISLSSWIRDYLYLPLSGARVEDRSTGGLERAVTGSQRNRALFGTWALMGLWHGANWTFVIWGLYHALVIFVYRLLAPLVRPLPERLRIVAGAALTLPIMMLAWVPFRAQSLGDTFTMWGKVLQAEQYLSLGMRENTYLIAAALLLAMWLVYSAKQWLHPRLQRSALLLATGETAVYAVVIALVFVFLRPISQFIYFQF